MCHYQYKSTVHVHIIIHSMFVHSVFISLYRFYCVQLAQHLTLTETGSYCCLSFAFYGFQLWS